jgi:hypothetical protein
MAQPSLAQHQRESTTEQREPSRCEECGVSSHDRALVGTRNVRERNQPMWCLEHHPEFLAGGRSLSVLGAGVS